MPYWLSRIIVALIMGVGYVIVVGGAVLAYREFGIVAAIVFAAVPAGFLIAWPFVSGRPWNDDRSWTTAFLIVAGRPLRRVLRIRSPYDHG